MHGAVPSPRQHSSASVWKLSQAVDPKSLAASLAASTPNNMPQNLALRGNSFLWSLRFLQAAVAFLVMGITAANASDWTAISCQIPKTLGINVFAATITIPFLGYFMAATGPHRLAYIPWSQWASLGIEGFLFCVWLAAQPASNYNCATVCRSCSTPENFSAAPQSFYIWVGSLTCACSFEGDKEKGYLKAIASRVLRKARSRPGKGLESTKIVSTAERMAAKQGFDIIMIALFAISLSVTIWSVWRQRKLVNKRGRGMAITLPKEYRDEKASTFSVSVTPVSPKSP